MSNTAIEEPSSRFSKENKKNILTLSLQKFKALFSQSKTKTTSKNSKKNHDKWLLNNLISFSDKTVEDIMIPRSEIVALKSDMSQNELVSFFINSSHTRLPVYKDSLDNILGYVHVKDLLKLIATKSEFNINKLVRKPLIAAPSMQLTDLLIEMQNKQIHIAIVADEYGGTAGMITIKDISRQILGDIYDEHGAIKGSIKDYRIINSNTILASARMEIEQLEELFDVQLKTEQDEFDTIGGLVLNKAEALPVKGSIVKLSDNLDAHIIDVNARSIKLVKIVKHTE